MAVRRIPDLEPVDAIGDGGRRLRTYSFTIPYRTYLSGLSIPCRMDPSCMMFNNAERIGVGGTTAICKHTRLVLPTRRIQIAGYHQLERQPVGSRGDADADPGFDIDDLAGACRRIELQVPKTAGESVDRRAVIYGIEAVDWEIRALLKSRCHAVGPFRCAVFRVVPRDSSTRAHRSFGQDKIQRSVS